MDKPHYHAEVVTSFADRRQVIGVDHYPGASGEAVIELTSWNERQGTDLFSAGVLTPKLARTLAGHLLAAADEADRSGTERPCPEPVPATQPVDEPRTVLAFCAGNHCVVVTPRTATDGAGEDGQPSFSFELPRPVPDGTWAGCFDVPAGGLSELKERIAQAAEVITSEDVE